MLPLHNPPTKNDSGDDCIKALSFAPYARVSAQKAQRHNPPTKTIRGIIADGRYHLRPLQSPCTKSTGAQSPNETIQRVITDSRNDLRPLPNPCSKTTESPSSIKRNFLGFEKKQAGIIAILL